MSCRPGTGRLCQPGRRDFASAGCCEPGEWCQGVDLEFTVAISGAVAFAGTVAIGAEQSSAAALAQVLVEAARLGEDDRPELAAEVERYLRELDR